MPTPSLSGTRIGKTPEAGPGTDTIADERGRFRLAVSATGRSPFARVVSKGVPGPASESAGGTVVVPGADSRVVVFNHIDEGLVACAAARALAKSGLQTCTAAQRACRARCRRAAPSSALTPATTSGSTMSRRSPCLDP